MEALSTISILLLIFTLIIILFTYIKGRKKFILLSKSAINFLFENKLKFISFILIFLTGFGVALSATNTSQQLENYIYTTATKSTIPNSIYNAMYFIPTPETFVVTSVDNNGNATNGYYTSIEYDGETGISIEEMYNPQLGDPSVNYYDPTPNNLRDNSAWCNEIVWDYPKNIDEAKDQNEKDNIIKYNQLPGTYYGLEYTKYFTDLSNTYPFLKISGLENISCLYFSISEYSKTLTNQTTSVGNWTGISLNEEFKVTLEAKLNLKLIIDGKSYDLQMVSLAKPNTNNSFKYKNFVYYPNNFIDNNGNEIASIIEEDQIYFINNEITNFSLGESVIVHGGVSNNTIGVEYYDQLNFRGYGNSSQYLTVSDQFTNSEIANKNIKFSRDDDLIVGYVSSETFYKVATKLYSDDQITGNIKDMYKQEYSNNIFDLSMSILYPNHAIGLVENFYKRDGQFLNPKYSYKDDNNAELYGYYQLDSGGVPRYLNINSNAQHNHLINNDTSDAKYPFYIGFWNQNDNDIYMSPTSDQSNSFYVAMHYYNKSANNQVNSLTDSSEIIVFFNSLSKTTSIIVFIVTTLLMLFIIYEFTNKQKISIGINKSNGYDKKFLSVAYSSPLLFLMIFLSLFLFLIAPLFSLIWQFSILSETSFLIGVWFTNFTSFSIYVLFPIITSWLLSFFYLNIRIRSSALKLIYDRKIYKPNISTIIYSRTKLSKKLSNLNFNVDYSIKNIINSSTKMLSVIIGFSIFIYFVLLTISISNVYETTSQNATEKINILSGSLNNPTAQFQDSNGNKYKVNYQYKSMEVDEFLISMENNQLTNYTFDLDLNKSPLYKESDFDLIIQNSLSYISDTPINGDEYITKETFNWIKEYLENTIEQTNNNTHYEIALNYYINLMSTGYKGDESDPNYISLGFKVNNPNIDSIIWNLSYSSIYNKDSNKSEPVVTPILIPPNFIEKESLYYCTIDNQYATWKEVEDHLALDPHYQYIEYDAQVEYCSVKSNPQTRIRTETIFIEDSQFETLLDGQNFMNESIYDWYKINQVKDGKINILIDSNQIASKGDIFVENPSVDYLLNKEFFIDNKEHAFNPDIVIFDKIKQPLPFGMIIPINDPDFIDNSYKDENGNIIDGLYKPIMTSYGYSNLVTYKKGPSEINDITLSSMHNQNKNEYAYPIKIAPNKQVLIDDNEYDIFLNESKISSLYSLPNINTWNSIIRLIETVGDIGLFSIENENIYSELLNRSNYLSNLSSLDNYLDNNIKNENINNTLGLVEPVPIESSRTPVTQDNLGRSTFEIQWNFVLTESGSRYVNSVIDWNNSWNDKKRIYVKKGDFLFENESEFKSKYLTSKYTNESLDPRKYNWVTHDNTFTVNFSTNKTEFPASPFIEKISFLNIDRYNILENNLGSQNMNVLNALLVIGDNIYDDYNAYDSIIQYLEQFYDRYFISIDISNSIESEIYSQTESMKNISFIVALLFLSMSIIVLIFNILVVAFKDKKDFDILKSIGWNQAKATTSSQVINLIAIIVSFFLGILAASLTLPTIASSMGYVLGGSIAISLNINQNQIIFVFLIVLLIFILLYGIIFMLYNNIHTDTSKLNIND